MLRGLKVQLAIKVLTATLVRLVLKGLKVPLAIKVLMVIQAHPVHKDLRVIPVQLDQ